MPSELREKLRETERACQDEPLSAEAEEPQQVQEEVIAEFKVIRNV